jgi:hypothetical protein
MGEDTLKYQKNYPKHKEFHRNKIIFSFAASAIKTKTSQPDLQIQPARQQQHFFLNGQTIQ